MHRTIAVMIGLMALALFAQSSLLDQGRAAMARNDDDAAAALFEKAVAQNPKSAEAHYLLGSAYGSQAQKASIFGQASLAGKTRDEFEKAVELDPNHLEARFALLQYYAFAPGIMGGSYGCRRWRATPRATRTSSTAGLVHAEARRRGGRESVDDSTEAFLQRDAAEIDEQADG